MSRTRPWPRPSSAWRTRTRIRASPDARGSRRVPYLSESAPVGRTLTTRQREPSRCSSAVNCAVRLRLAPNGERTFTSEENEATAWDPCRSTSNACGVPTEIRLSFANAIQSDLRLPCSRDSVPGTSASSPNAAPTAIRMASRATFADSTTGAGGDVTGGGTGRASPASLWGGSLDPPVVVPLPLRPVCTGGSGERSRRPAPAGGAAGGGPADGGALPEGGGLAGPDGAAPWGGAIRSEAASSLGEAVTDSPPTGETGAATESIGGRSVAVAGSFRNARAPKPTATKSIPAPAYTRQSFHRTRQGVAAGARFPAGDTPILMGI